MKYRLSLMVLLVASGVLGRSAGAAQAACDRACLIGILDAYLSAVVTHDSARAPLAANLRSTENAVEVTPGQGLWRSATGLGKTQRRYADTAVAQAAYWGLIEEGATTAIVALRIAVTDRKINEAEWIVARQGSPLYNLDGLTADAPAAQVIALAARTPRAAMIAAADSYFQGLQDHSGAKVLAHEGCVRVENGTMVTSRPGEKATSAPQPAPANGPAVEFERGDCDTNLERMQQIAAVIERRYVVDVEAGVVAGWAVFARNPEIKRRDGSPWPRLLLCETFTIDSGRIRGIYAAMNYLPLEIPGSGWGK